MKSSFFICLFILLISNVHAQVGIGTVSPNSTLQVVGSFSATYRSFTTSSTASSTDHALVFTGTSAASLTLPDATACAGRLYLIKNASTSGITPVLTINTTSSQTIDGIATLLLSQAYQGVILVSNGANWNVSAQTASASSGTGWLLGGNSVSSIQNLGTTSNYDLPFITNNIEGMRLSAAGNFGIGTSTFNATYPEKLVVNAGTTTSVNAIVGKGSINNYLQLNIQNSNAGTNASSDVVATADNGTETVNYVDLGINSSANTSGIMGNANDAYLYTTGNNFLMGTANNNALVFMTGGQVQSANERMRISGTGNVGIGTNSPSYLLHVVASSNPLYLGGVQTGLATDSVLTIINGVVRKLSPSALATSSSNAWTLGGNNVSSIQNLGTTSNYALPFITNNTERMRIDSAGKVGIGTTTPGADLTLFQGTGGASPARGFRFAGNSIGGTNSGTGFGVALGYNISGNKQLWLGDADYLGNSTGTFVRYSSSAGLTIFDAIAGDNSVRRPIEIGVSTDPLSAIVLGSDQNATAPGSYIWANGNMAIGNSYRSNAAPSNGVIVQGNVGIGTVSPSSALHVVGTNPLTLIGVQTGLGTDSVLTIINGVVRKISPSTLTTSAANMWALGGNGVSSIQNLGTTSNYDLPFITNNTEKMRLSASGNLGVGTSAFNATNPEKLVVSAGTTSSVNAIVGNGSINNYLQLNIQNTNAGTNASSDVVATADNGNETTNYVDLGINSSANTSGIMGGVDDAYLYTTGNNFLMGTGTASKALVFMTGGTVQSTNERMRIDGSGNVGIGTNSTTSKFEVSGTGGTLSEKLTSTAATDRSILQSSNTATNGGSIDIRGYGASYSETIFGNSMSGGSALVSINTSGTGILGMGTYNSNDFVFGTSNSERMRITSGGSVGIATSSPTSSLDVNGSVGHAITTTTSNITLSNINYTVIITGGTPTITLPAASTNTRKIFVIVNETGSARTMSAYLNFSGTSTTTIAANSSITVQTDGTNWYRIQ